MTCIDVIDYGGTMNNFEKYKILSAGKPFAHRAKIAMVMLDSATVYEELKEDASKTSVPGDYGCLGGFPENILEMLVSELICRETWYLPDVAKIWDRRFGSLLKINSFAMTMMRRFGARFCTGTFWSLSGCQKKRIIARQGAITKLGNILENF